MTIEDEVLFQKFGITGYDVNAPGLCDDTSGAGGNEHPGPVDCQGLDTLEGQYDIRPGSD